MNSLLQDIVAKLRLIVGRCMISAVKFKDGSSVADLELLAGEMRRNVEFLQQFGFSSRPTGDVSGVALFIGGARENGVVVGSRGDDKSMTDVASKLDPGEVAVHSPFGSSVVLKKDGSIVAKPAMGKNFWVKGPLYATGEVVAYCQTNPYLLSSHTHGSAVGPTSNPIPTPPPVNPPD